METLIRFREGKAEAQVLDGLCFHAQPALYLKVFVQQSGAGGVPEPVAILGDKWGNVFGDGDCCFMSQEDLADFIAVLTRALESWKNGGWELAREATVRQSDENGC